MIPINVNSQEALHMQITVALNVIPMISKQVAYDDDRRVIVADIVACWLALPTDTRDWYASMAHHAFDGLVHFVWEYVDAVEQAIPVGVEAVGQLLADNVDETLMFYRWVQRLEQVKAMRTAGDPPDRQWLAGFPRDLDGTSTTGAILKTCG